MNLSVKTKDGSLIAPTLNIAYRCKSCGHINELVRLSGAGKSFMELNCDEQYDSMCHKCDDVEKIQFQIEESPREFN